MLNHGAHEHSVSEDVLDVPMEVLKLPTLALHRALGVLVSVLWKLLDAVRAEHGLAIAAFFRVRCDFEADSTLEMVVELLLDIVFLYNLSVFYLVSFSV